MFDFEDSTSEKVTDNGEDRVLPIDGTVNSEYLDDDLQPVKPEGFIKAAIHAIKFG